MIILIAEDDPLILMTLEVYFKNEGYEVVTANNGREALQKLDEFIPDILVTDIMMPFYSGLELIGRIKSGLGKKVSVIVLSAMGQEDTIKEAFALGADDYITKPFNLVELSLRVKRLVKAEPKVIQLYTLQLLEKA